MIDRLSKAAETLATDVSRRSFLDKAGKGALALAAGLGGLLAASSGAHAAKGGGGGGKPPKEPGKYCCSYGYPEYWYFAKYTCQTEPCAPALNGVPLLGESRVRTCRECGRSVV